VKNLKKENIVKARFFGYRLRMTNLLVTDDSYSQAVARLPEIILFPLTPAYGGIFDLYPSPTRGEGTKGGAEAPPLHFFNVFLCHEGCYCSVANCSGYLPQFLLSYITHYKDSWR
jgi:hypothetical protein